MYSLDTTAAANPDMPSDRERNILLNNSEYNEGKVTLESTPEGVGIGAHYACNAKCVFCLGEKTNFFSLERYRDFFEPRLGNVISNARFVNFCGFGELLLMPDIEKFLEYVNKSIPHVNKIYTTNGSPLRSRKILWFLTQTSSVVQISLHASRRELHKKLTGMDLFDEIVASVKTLVALRRKKEYPAISLIFLITALNIENLPDFVEFAALLGVDEVICNYLTVFNPNHLELSCFFKKEFTNESLNRAEERAKKFNFSVRLPPKFGKPAEPDKTYICSDPWKYCYIENEGSVLACCYAGSHFGYIGETDFEGIWNGADYRNLRCSLVKNSSHEWCSYCHRYRSENVNDIRSHINSRLGFREEILKKYPLPITIAAYEKNTI